MTRRALCLAGAVVVGIVAIAPFADTLADGSFAWHMVQHLLMLFVMPPLLLFGDPFAFVSRALPKAQVAALVRMTAPVRACAHPAIALGVFVAIVWLTHFSSLYERALENEVVHAAEHLAYLAAGIVFWLPVIAPPPMPRPPYAARMLYLLLAMPQGALLAFALDGARAPLYAHYAMRLGSGALADQENGAAIMWIAGGVVLFAAFLATLAYWAVRERRTV